ncbi:bi-functional coumaroyl CoA and feruloyl CoA ortho-hydroxylase F6H2-2-1-like [Juglans microcarpa x Juglans regia]|uniref:bi-functional coumaroyl CoA and feruloyl CoA ortho-hydroxylase F6H2-2-1-like n=1 Tax=Juglans microcarpa x Juglans regia TaxID=2249226 RepID=UPI001B7F4154|nr:bi-functional coumaroyl CoA and feruloyl CoA ortho-hydroxylase F6H2-2-1-like [Juglans microcarpa x Juglans regia]
MGNTHRFETRQLQARFLTFSTTITDTCILRSPSMSTSTPKTQPMSTTISSSSDVIDFVVRKGNGITGLVELGIESVPERYIQPQEERFDPSKVETDESIPSIDVSNWDDPKVADSICDAASKRGFFQIINHGVPLEVLEDMKNAAHRFFQLPVEERKKYLKENSPSESVCLVTSFSTQAEKVLEWKDSLKLVWVSENEASAVWPPACKDQALEYVKRGDLLIRRLLEVLLKRLGVKALDEKKESMLMGGMSINLNHYPCCPNPELVVGVGRHSDISTLTVLLQDESGGLYVRGTKHDSWIHLSPVKGALIINIGDALQIMSNDLYKSIEHRAFTNRNQNRVSIPIFAKPGPDAIIGPMLEVLESGQRPMYKNVVYKDYLKSFFGKAHDGKQAVEFARI